MCSRLRAVCLFYIAIAAGEVAAVSNIVFDVGEIAGDGWRIEDARAVLTTSDAGVSLRVFVPTMIIGGETVAWLQGLEVGCAQLSVNERYLACKDGTLRAGAAETEVALRSALSVVYRRSDGAWRAQGRLTLDKGALNWSMQRKATGLHAMVTGESLALGRFERMLPFSPQWVPSPAGTLSRFSLELHLPEKGAASATFEASGDDLGFDSAGGRYAAAGVSARVKGAAEWAQREWRLHASASLSGGEFLVGPLYTRIGEKPIELTATLAAGPEFIDIEQLEFRDPAALSFQASARWDRSTPLLVAAVELESFSASLPAFYDRYLQSVAAHYGFGRLSTSGTIRGELERSASGFEKLHLDFDGVDVIDEQARLEVAQMNGGIQWRAAGEPQPSRLSWQSASVYKLSLGRVNLQAETVGDSLRLTRETAIPVLDGQLIINAFKVTNWLTEDAKLLFDAALKPVSLADLSRTLDWPPLSGSLSGRIPALTYDDGVYRLGGSLKVEAFDGVLFVDNLRLERPLGVLPKLVADVELQNLNLEKLTSTFAFGRIEGRLGGFVRELRLLDWEPVHFVAAFRTPENDPSEHVISQRAVDTLTSIGGGGAGGALSRGFLRFFDEFKYRRLGIECRLSNNVCRMGGVAPAPGGGYYIVEGRGIPRVDVIGHVREVDWPQLMSQLLEATRGQGPRVKASEEGN